jgi:5-methylcytosine-specific restriction endonuclease McrA
MANKISSPGKIHLRIIEVMKRFPEGISGGQIRQELEKEGLRAEEQTHLDRRKRDLKKWFVIEKQQVVQELLGRRQKTVLYKYVGKRKHVTDEGDISLKTRAEVIHAAHGRCHECGRTIEKHGIALVVDHRVPREWGGGNERENLEAICEDCNAGKKAYFSSFAPEKMKNIMIHKSVHVRLGEALKTSGVGERTPSSFLDFVAGQDDWHKRLRELRYPVIGWEIETRAYKNKSGKKKVDYVLKRYRVWPDNPTALIRRFEKDRERKNKNKKR